MTVLTYKSEGSMFLSYLRKLQLPYTVEEDKDLEAEFLLKAASLITVEDISALSKHKLSYTGQQKGQRLEPLQKTHVYPKPPGLRTQLEGLMIMLIAHT